LPNPKITLFTMSSIASLTFKNGTFLLPETTRTGYVELRNFKNVVFANLTIS